MALTTFAKVSLVIALLAVAGALLYYYFVYAGGSSGDDDIPVRHDVPFFEQAVTAKMIRDKGYLFANAQSWFSDAKGFSLAFDFMITSQASNALLAISNTLLDQYVAVYVQDGRCYFEWYINGSSVVALADANTYGVADGEWHSIRVARDGAQWTLERDDVRAPPVSRPLERTLLATDLYVGNRPLIEVYPGVPGLTGCVRNVRVNGSSDPPEMYAHGTLVGARKCVRIG